MNDRFKFRVTCSKHPKGSPFLYFNIGDEICIEDCCIVEQCTGLRDKNGKLIFEGDIGFDVDSEVFFVIKWEEAYSGPQWCACDKKGCPDFYGGIPLNFIIVGNIHKNGDLLN